MIITRISTLIILTAMSSLLACGDSLESVKGSEDTSKKADKAESGSNEEATQSPDEKAAADALGEDATERVPCAPAPKSADFSTIAGMVAHINTLPKPLSIPCLVDTLPKPLKVNATISDLSVQPAVGSSNPRIFLFVDRLILSFVPIGKGSETVEFSELKTDELSIKGELAFPVEKELASDAAYARIMRNDGVDGTTCVGCHLNETKSSDKVFESKALRPFLRQNIDLTQLKSLYEICGGRRDLRCDILDSIFRETPPEPASFPESMPTLF